ncbi:MAG TPA: PD-(D/E)XK nuclease-like domain-containing protein, partial [Steroidobacteraceae bacterium]|nr:PD-(D/E)XK nuclease-like domain-containing protein [Steroidobacteraceae bacterium]
MNAVAAIRSRVPAEEYLASEGTSITRLKELRRSPQHYRYFLEHPKQTQPLLLGTAAHVAVLEPERFEQQFAVWTRRSEKTGNLCPRNGQHWDAFQAQHGGKQILTEDECSIALTIGSVVRADPVASKYLQSGEPEVVMEWELHGRRCRGRVDWLTLIEGEPVIVGLKTTRDCRPFIFGAQCAKLGYHLQFAWYQAGYRVITGRKAKVVEIVVESTPPHAVIVYRVPEDVILQ